MKVNIVSGSSSIAFSGVKKFSQVVLPVSTKNLDKLSLNIENGRYLVTRKNNKTTTTFLEGVSKLTQWFNGDKLVGTLFESVSGQYCGNRFFSDGVSIEYSTFGDKVGTTIRKNGAFISHTTGQAYKQNGKPNIMTRKDVANMQQILQDVLKNGKLKSPKESAEALEEFFGKKF